MNHHPRRGPERLDPILDALAASGHAPTTPAGAAPPSPPGRSALDEQALREVGYVAGLFVGARRLDGVGDDEIRRGILEAAASAAGEGLPDDPWAQESFVEA